MSDLSLKSFAEFVGEDAKKIAKEKILPKALDLAKGYLETGAWNVTVSLSATPTLTEAVERAKALDGRLGDKVENYENAKALAGLVVHEALKIATKLALAAV